jgi:hypothetical protein
LQIEADGRLVTIFSAPNYCDQMGNEGAIIRIGKDLECKYRQFKAVPHPQVIRLLKSASLVAKSHTRCLQVRPMAFAGGGGFMSLFQ